jgi:protocatechuate 3,4-dioxygenase beta subunit
MSSFEQDEEEAQQPNVILQQQDEEEKKELCSRLEPTLNVAWGPLWYPGHTLHETSTMDAPAVICSSHDNDPSSDKGELIKATSIFTRSTIQPTRGIVFQLHGRVLDLATCQPIPNAVIDFWQPDNRGRYSTSPHGDCRGAVLTDTNGRYAVQTVMSGNYGITGGLGLWGIELPPYSLAHLHVTVFAPNHAGILTTQLTFPDDATRGRDFREYASTLSGGKKYELSHESLILDIQEEVHSNANGHAVPTATFDFVVTNNTSSNDKDEITGRDLFENLDALKQIICLADGFEPGEPFPLCQGGRQQHGVLKFVYTHVPMRIIMVTFGPCLLYGVPIVLSTLIGYLIRFMLGGKSTKSNKTKHD